MVTPPAIAGLTPIEILGSGGFADVWCCQQIQPSRLVAVKVLKLPGGQVELFREANIVAQLQHPNIVPVFATGLADDGRAFLMMPLLSSDTLSHRIRSAPLSLGESLSIGIQIASAVATAHENQVLHRDIKPANILFDQYSIPMLCDFGISAFAQQVHLADSSLSIPWAAPEIVQGTQPPSPRSEVYSLGATIWEALSGESPFYQRGERLSVEELMHRVVTGQRRPLSRRDVPGELNSLLDDCLSADPQRRPQSAADLAFALQSVEQSLGLPPTQAVFPNSNVGTRQSRQRVTESFADASSLVTTHLRPVVMPPTSLRPSPVSGAAPRAGSARSPLTSIVIMLLSAVLVFGGFKAYQRFGPTLTATPTQAEPIVTPPADITLDGIKLARVRRSSYLKTSIDECVKIPASGPPISVGCQEANAQKIFAIAQIVQNRPSENYESVANRWCTAQYQSTVSQTFNAGDFVFLYPVPDSWALGDRFIVCLRAVP